ncbi:MAG: VOC family protein [Myxococcota bacterium]
MPETATAPRPAVTPYLSYSDAPAAIEFLTTAFGFEEVFRFPMEDGRIGHAELSFGGSIIMLASVYKEMGFASPQDLAGIHTQIQVAVDDVDAHFERARDAGAVVTSEPEDQFYGDRSYRATDPEGHRWVFSQHIRDVPPEEWKLPE